MLNWLEKQGFLILYLFTARHYATQNPEVSSHTSFPKLRFLLSSPASTVLDLLALHHLHHFFLHSGLRYKAILCVCIYRKIWGWERYGTRQVVWKMFDRNPYQGHNHWTCVSLQCLMFNVSVCGPPFISYILYAIIVLWLVLYVHEVIEQKRAVGLQDCRLHCGLN